MSFPNPTDYVASTARTHVRTARGRYTQQGGRWSAKLLGQSAILMIDPKAPWFVLAQFDDLDHPYWAHGWHPMPASAFGGIQVQHVLDYEAAYCSACGMTERELFETAEDDCKVLDIEPTIDFREVADLSLADSEGPAVLTTAEFTWKEVRATEIDTENGPVSFVEPNP